MFAPEYIVFILILMIFGCVLKNDVILLFCLALSTCLLYFFRGATTIPNYFNQIDMYCPCDGIVSNIAESDSHVRISIFLNIHNCHIQYAPFDCLVRSIQHIPGSFHPAYMLQKSQYNERVVYVLVNEYFGPVIFVQIAGQLARRIVSFVKPGEKLTAQEPLGLIKLGSRCDLVIKKGNLIHIQKGSRVRIGDVIMSRSREL